MLLIKSTEDASYSNVIDVLDEVLINNVKICYCKNGSRRNRVDKRSVMMWSG